MIDEERGDILDLFEKGESGKDGNVVCHDCDGCDCGRGEAKGSDGEGICFLVNGEQKTKLRGGSVSRN